MLVRYRCVTRPFVNRTMPSSMSCSHVFPLLQPALTILSTTALSIAASLMSLCVPRRCVCCCVGFVCGVSSVWLGLAPPPLRQRETAKPSRHWPSLRSLHTSGIAQLVVAATASYVPSPLLLAPISSSHSTLTSSDCAIPQHVVPSPPTFLSLSNVRVTRRHHLPPQQCPTQRSRCCSPSCPPTCVSRRRPPSRPSSRPSSRASSVTVVKEGA